MSEFNDIVKLAVDGYKGTVEKYSVAQSQETIRKALIKANNGKSYLDYRDIRDGKCPELFSLVEMLISRTSIEGLQNDDYFNSLVEFRNVADGDRAEFIVNDNSLFIVSEAADGTQAVRRQRLAGAKSTTIPTSYKTIRIYEEMNRVLSGRVDFNEMITKVSESINQKLLNDIYSLWIGATATQLGGTAYFPTAGAYDADTLLDVISHVEAAAGGKSATIIGTKKGLRNLKEDIQSDGAKDELHNMGYYGKFYGTPCVAIPQRHKVGTTDFVFDDDVLTIIAGDDKPIKVVYEGQPIVDFGNFTDNMDLTQEYFYGVKYGTGLVVAGENSGIGRYEIAGA